MICHDRKITIKNEDKVITTEGKQYNYLNEYIISGYCDICKNLFVLHLYETYNGTKIKREYRGKNAVKFLSKVIQTVRMYKSQQIDYRLYLNYNEYGTTKKCYSNLSSLKLGREDTYQGLRKTNNAA